MASQVALVVSILPANAGDKRDLGSIPELERTRGEGNGSLLKYACLEKPIDRGAWQATVHRLRRVRHNLVTKPPPHSKTESLFCTPETNSVNQLYFN